MIRRRRLLLALTLLLGALALVPGVRWPVVGWLRGEAFYQGMPASWWESIAQSCFEEVEPNQYGDPWVILCVDQPGWVGLLEAVFPVRIHYPDPTDPLWGRDPEALPMLAGLCRSEDPKVRRLTFYALQRLGPVAVPLLEELCNDPDAGIRGLADDALRKVRAEEG